MAGHLTIAQAAAWLTAAEVERRAFPVLLSQPGTIYVMFDRANRAYKIGFTTRTPKARLREMRTGHPGRVDIRWDGPGTYADEAAIHRLLRPSRLSGEWFAETDVVRIAVALLPSMGARWLGECDLNMLQTFVPIDCGVPNFYRMNAHWGAGGYFPDWTTRPCEL